MWHQIGMAVISVPEIKKTSGFEKLSISSTAVAVFTMVEQLSE